MEDRIDQRPIVRSEAVIPFEIAEFDSDGLANVRQGVKLTPTCRPPPAASELGNS